MPTRFPFSFLDGSSASSWRPAAWVVDETQQRLLLLINHVLMQEPEAMRRLQPAMGKTLMLRWGRFSIGLVVTAAGLFDRVGEASGDAARPFWQPDLALTLAEESPLALVQAALRGEKPPLRIEGDAQLASEINWLVDHVRWDVEEDLSKIMGDAAARALGAMAQRMVRALREFAPKSFGAGGSAATDGAGDASRAPGGADPMGPR